MKIAIEGCMHGELDKVYATLKRMEEEENTKIDLLLCCGDFQAVRNLNDLESMNVKPNFRRMNSFWKYYSGQAVAPYPTIFIGGNHEASNYLWELYYGGWAAPNIYFLGFAGVVKFGNIRIGGLSGIYKQNHYSLGHFERLPYNENDIRSIYHVREYDVLKLMQFEEPIDIFISHDWPLGITEYGNSKKLVRDKPFFKEEDTILKENELPIMARFDILWLGNFPKVEKRSLGSRPAAELLAKLKPPYWFSAHLHCKFPAIIQHGEDGPVTKFLALDKCLPRRKFLQILEIESEPGPFEIHFDEEWLAITRMFNSSFPLTRRSAKLVAEQLDKQAHQQWVRNKLSSRGPKPFDFVQTVPSYDPDQPHTGTTLNVHCRNPQTEAFLQFLELPYLLDAAAQSITPVESTIYSADAHLHSSNINDESIDLDDVDEMEELTTNEEDA